MDKVKDRFIVPIYNIYYIDDFKTKIEIEETLIDISLKIYSKDNDNFFIKNKDFKEILEEDNKNSFKTFYQNIMLDEKLIQKEECKVYLVVDFFQPMKNNDLKLLDIIMTTFHLLLKDGVVYHRYFQKSFYNKNLKSVYSGTATMENGLTIYVPHEEPYSFSPFVGGNDCISLTELNTFEKVFKLIYLLEKEQSQYSRILKQSIDYHRLAKTFLNNEQAFVTLMITIEAMFKKNQDENSSKYISRVTRFLSKNKRDNGKLSDSFKFFSNIRNDIVHGDKFLEDKELIKKLLELYEYVRLCILKILEINSIKPLENYYEDLFLEIEKRWEVIKTSLSKQ